MIVRETAEYGVGSEEILDNSFKTLNGKGGNKELRMDEAYNYYTLNYSGSWFYHIARKNGD